MHLSQIGNLWAETKTVKAIKQMYVNGRRERERLKKEIAVIIEIDERWASSSNLKGCGKSSSMELEDLVNYSK